MKASVLAFVQMKGGVGKTSLALHTADMLHHAGQRVLVVDLDPQCSARLWSVTAAEGGFDAPTVVSSDAETLPRDLPRLARDLDFVVIDCPPSLSEPARAGVVLADLVVVPVQPGGTPVWALRHTFQVLKEARTFKPGLRAWTVLNFAERTLLSRATRETLRAPDAEFPMFEEEIGKREAFNQAITAGQGIQSYAPDSTAAAEMQALTARLLAELDRDLDLEACAR